jgi:MFS family permease
LATITGVWNLLHQAMMVALVLHVQENLGLGPEVYGLVLSGAAAGGILGSLIGPRIVAALGSRRTAQVMLAASAPAFLGIALAPGAWTLGLAMALFEFTGLVWNLVAVSYRQKAIPAGLLGRVNSLYRLIATGMMPLGLVLSGWVMALGEGVVGRPAALQLPFWLAALGAVGLTVWGWRAVGRGFAG